jgi:aryl-alcohol dehydrogenase-like predicted oxidoreductase
MSEFSDPVVLGASGLEVRRMGIGADAGISAAALEWAFERGINYFYWGSRRCKGMRDAIRNLAPRWRDRMVIAIQSYDYTGLALEHTFTRGLRQLGIEHADVLILGMRNGRIPERILHKAVALKDKGLARHLCVSAHNRLAYRSHLDRNAFDLVMVRYNAAHRGAETEVFPLREGREGEDGPGVICFNSTRWGHLFDPRWVPKGERTPSPVDLYRYVLSNPHIHMVLTAPRTLEQLEENLEALEAGPVSTEERQWLERVGDHVHALNPNTNFDFLFQTSRPRREPGAAP